MSTPTEASVPDQIVASGPEEAGAKSNGLHSNKSGWDGKLRLDKNKKAVLANPEALSDPEYSDEDAPPVDQIEADEGIRLCSCSPPLINTDDSRQTCSKMRILKPRSFLSLLAPALLY